MSIQKRVKTNGKASYLVRVATVDELTGRRTNTNLGTFSTLKEAQSIERNGIVQRDRGTLLDPSTLTVSELLDAWLAVKKTEVAGNSYVDYETVVRLYVKPALGKVRVQALRADRVQAQLAAWTGAGMSARMVRGCLMRLSQALDQAVRLGLVAANVTTSVKAPKLAVSHPDVWNVAQAVRFLESAKGDHLAPLWHFLLLEGMRRGEGLGLRWGDVDLVKGTAHLQQTTVSDKSNKGRAMIQPRTKTSAGARTVRLTPETLEVLKAHRAVWLAKQLASTDWQPTDLIVSTRDGGPISPGGNVSRAFDRLVELAKLPPIRVHDLRHTHATILLRGGVSAKVVSERLGHAKIGITLDTYSHLTGDMQDSAPVAISRLLAAASGGAS